MVLLDLLPAGAIQFKSVVDHGLWFGRSATFIEGDVFLSFTWLRGIGATVFYGGGVLPLTWFVITRIMSMKGRPATVEPEPIEEEELELVT